MKIRNLALMIILFLFFMLNNIVPIYALSDLTLIYNRNDNATSPEYSDFNFKLIENLKQIHEDNYKADISKLESINPDSDKILLIDLESGETKKSILVNLMY